MSEFDKTKDILAEIINRLDRIESNIILVGYLMLGAILGLIFWMLG